MPEAEPEVDLCTKEGLVETYPCLQCLNNSELWAVLVMILATINNKDVSTDLNEMMEDAACIACLTDKQLFEGLVKVIGFGVINPETPMDEIRADVKCLLCVDPKMIKAMALKEFCTWMQAPV